MQQKILIDRLKERSLLMTVNRMYINEGDSLNSFHGTYCLGIFDNRTGSAVNLGAMHNSYDISLLISPFLAFCP